MLGYSIGRKSNDRKIYKRFIPSMHDGIIFYEFVAARIRYVGTNVSRGVVALGGVSVFARSTEGCPAFTTESRGIADKDSSQFTVMPSPAGKTREGNPVPRFSSCHIPNLDGDRLPFQCPALGYHAPRTYT